MTKENLRISVTAVGVRTGDRTAAGTRASSRKRKEGGPGTRIRMRRIKEMRVMREEMRRVGKRTGGETVYTLYRIVVANITNISLITACSLLVKKSVKKRVYIPFILTDLVLKTCGGPAPGAAPDRPKVLLLLPSRTLGRGSVPAKRASPPTRGAGPKLPWPHAKAAYRNTVTARDSLEGATSPPPRGGGTSRPQLPRTPSMAMAGRRRRPPLAADILTFNGKLFVWMRTSILKNYTKTNVYDSGFLLNELLTLNGSPPACLGTDRATRGYENDDGTYTINTTYLDHGMITYIIITMSRAVMRWTQADIDPASGRRRARAVSSSRR